jgi:hypothetical protein
MTMRTSCPKKGVWNFQALRIPAFVGALEFQTPFFGQSPIASMRDDWNGSKKAASAEECEMTTVRKQMSLFVDRSSQQWIVRDADGNFWLVPPVEQAWEHRQPFEPSEETDLEPVPGHYKHMLGLPF